MNEGESSRRRSGPNSTCLSVFSMVIEANMATAACRLNSDQFCLKFPLSGTLDGHSLKTRGAVGTGRLFGASGLCPALRMTALLNNRPHSSKYRKLHSKSQLQRVFAGPGYTHKTCISLFVIFVMFCYIIVHLPGICIVLSY